jgi:succinate-semialdehyde dehydrogenase/glutarate-semialdehyde dehydrogenase
MPWNFPFWQVFRIAAPAIMAGNAMLIKHAPNVRKCAAAIDVLMQQILPKGVFSNLVIEIEEVENVIAQPAISMVTLTGSERAGSVVAALAGKYLKKSLLELGGSDAFIVLADADLDCAAKALVQSRFLNNGQACNAAKRAFIATDIFDIFIKKLKQELDILPYGEPVDKNAFFTHLARIDIAASLQQQVENSLGENARILYQKGKWQIENRKVPTMLIETFGEAAAKLPIMQEELFGPVLTVQRTDNQAISKICELANDTKYGLCAAVFTQNEAAIAYFQQHLNVGFIAINKAVSSDPRLPFGGVKNSGFGRELGAAGIQELCNRQTRTRQK